MSNKLCAILESLTDEELKAGVSEIKARHTTGILGDGVVRKLARAITREVGAEMHYSLQIAEDAIIQSAAFNWAGV